MFAESAAESWRKRFGVDPPDEIEIPPAFFRHRSVREYAEREIPESTIAALIGAAQSASTSSNLQLWSVVSVQNRERREEIARLCDNQRHVREAPWFLAFFVDCHRLARAARASGADPAGLDYAEFYTMAVIDVALAAERLMCAAESIGIYGCYIGALRNDVFAVREFFRLPPLTFGVFGLCLGYPAESSTADIKPRLSQESVWFREQYDEAAGIGDYDERMHEFYVKEGMNAKFSWSQKSGRRVSGERMTGRDAIKPFLTEQGLDLR